MPSAALSAVASAVPSAHPLCRRLCRPALKSPQITPNPKSPHHPPCQPAVLATSIFHGTVSQAKIYARLFYWTNLFGLFTGFPPIQKWELLRRFLFIQPNVPQRRWSFLRGYALLCDIFCLSRSKMAIFMLLCTFTRYFLLTWTSAKKEEAALLREFLLYSVIF